MHKKYIQVQTYDAEKYATKGLGSVLHRVRVDDKTEEELEQITKKIKNEQKLKNAEYKVNKNKETIRAQNKEPRVSSDKPPLKLDEKTGNTTIIFGSSKTGKSTLMMKLYKAYYDAAMTITVLFAMNPQIEIYKDKKIVSCPVMNENSADLIDWERKLNKKNHNKFNFLNMIDDFIELRTNQLVNNLILTYRNSNISSIICLQYVNLLSKQARANVNNIFLFRFNSDEAVEVAVKCYCQAIFVKIGIHKDNHIAYYKEMTDEHNYIYHHPMSGSYYFSKLDKWV